MIYIPPKLSNKRPSVGNSAFFYFAYILVSIDAIDVKLAPLESG